MTPDPAADRTSLAEWLDYGILAALPLLVVLLAGIWQPHAKNVHPYPPTRDVVLIVVCGAILAVLVVWRLVLALRGAPDAITSHRGSLLKLIATTVSFVVGVVFALILNRRVGGFHVETFLDRSAGVIGGFVVGIVFEAFRRDAPADHAARARRGLGVAYVLAGALCAIFGAVPYGRGHAPYLYGVLFFAVVGSLTASSYILIESVMTRATAEQIAAREPED
jgi:uncharacterized membrane protein